jgi:hypothetical protein
MEGAAMSGPHARIPVDNDRDRLLAAVLDRLWARYRERVEYVRNYEEVIAAHGGTFVNDHVAFRTLAGQRPTTGIVSVSRIFEALGYVPAGCYQFSDKHLSALHFQHPNGLFPKLFISELQTWRLSDVAQGVLRGYLSTHRPPLSDDVLRRAGSVSDRCSPSSTTPVADAPGSPIVDEIVDSLETLPWDVPQRADVEFLNGESQYAAWTLVHGYNVNHFTALINSHGVEALNDIERTIAALRAAGVPMKAEIEGAHGSKLRQTATEAVTIDVAVREGTMPWSYAYFELAERGEVTDPETGRRGRFEGFLGPQATQLFEMTRRA